MPVSDVYRGVKLLRTTVAQEELETSAVEEGGND